MSHVVASFRHRACAVVAGTLLAAGVVGGLGCASKRTFPPTDGETLLDTSLPPAPEVMSVALAAAHARGSTSEEPIVFNLPPNVQRSTWRRVTESLGAGARPMGPEDTLATSIERVQLDGGQARVDVVVPQGAAFQLFTVHLRGGGLAGWKATYVQPWTVRTEPPVSHSPWIGAVQGVLP